MDTRKPSSEPRSQLDMTLRDDASLPLLAGVRHRFVDLSELRMHVAEAGTGDPLLLLHGFPQHWWAWRKVIPALSERYRVICPDLRGAGWTDAPRAGYSGDHLVADVVELLAALDLRKVDILGYDWGGLVGFQLCLSHPEKVGRFVALGTPHPYPEFHPRILLSMWKLWPMLAVAMPVIGPRLLGSGRQRLPRWMMTSDTTDPQVWTPDDLDIFVSRLRDPARARAGSALYREFILREAKRSSAGAYRGTRLTTPTLSLYGAVLYGGNDAGREHPEILSGFENHADNFTLEHVPGAGYYLAEEQPDRVARRTTEFLAAS